MLPIRPFLPLGSELAASVIQQLGAVAFPIMGAEDAEVLAKEAERLIYAQQPEVYGSRCVRQNVSSTELEKGSELDALSDHLERMLSIYFYPGTFESSLSLGHRNVQRYPHNTIGIEPHYDESTNRNLVVLLALRGTGRFTVYEYLDGPVKVQWELTPGTLLLMKAPGFCGSTAADRPAHGVTRITGDPYRYLLGLRQFEPGIWGGGKC